MEMGDERKTPWKTLDERQNGNVQPSFVGASWVVSLAKNTLITLR
jgi:hypothetical protein